MDGTRLVALLAAIVGVLFLGHALYQLVQYGRLALVSLGFGLVFGAAAVLIRRRAPRE